MNASSSHTDFEFLDETPLGERESLISWIAFGALAALIALAYGNMLSYVSVNWGKPLYSHGGLVPVFAVYLLWIRRRPFVEVSVQERWLGVGLIAISLALRLYASYYDYNNPERLSFLGALLGASLLVGGWWMVRWAGPAIGFLAFMFPLPWFMENTLLLKLQGWATLASTVTFQLIGMGAYREGNVIHLDNTSEPLTVAEACSGLRMLTIFVAMCVAVALLTRRPWWDRLAILVSAVPIALASNVVRIVVTGLLFSAFPSAQKEGLLHKISHDFPGWGMMFVGMGLLGLLTSLLYRITVPDEDESDDVPAWSGARR